MECKQFDRLRAGLNVHKARGVCALVVIKTLLKTGRKYALIKPDLDTAFLLIANCVIFCRFQLCAVILTSLLQFKF